MHRPANLNRREVDPEQRAAISRGPFPDLRFEIIETVSDDHRGAASWSMTGTNTGPVGERPATGRKISARGMTIYYLENGRIAGHSQALDRLSVVQQLGLLGS